jgi:hypothetical protein
MMDAITFYLLRVAPTLMEWAVILFPLAVYLIWLGFDVSRRKRPTVLSGARDTKLLILALSGFFLIGPPTWILDRFAQTGWKSYVVGYGSYVVVLFFLAWSWVHLRRQSLVIYCIDPEAFPPIMRQVLDDLGEPYQVTPGRIAVDRNKLVLDLEASPTLYCVTVKWSGEAEVWASVESRLRTALVNVQTRNNPAGGLLPLYAGVTLMFCSLSTVIFVWYCAYLAL